MYTKLLRIISAVFNAADHLLIMCTELWHAIYWPTMVIFIGWKQIKAVFMKKLRADWPPRKHNTIRSRLFYAPVAYQKIHRL